MKYLILLISIVIFFPILANGQSFIKADDFVIKTPFLEPEDRILSQSIGKQGFVTIAKSKGTTKGDSYYILQHRRPDLSKKWSKEMRLASNENILHLRIIDEQVVIFTVIHDEKFKKTTLHADYYHLVDGNQISEKILLEHNIGQWNASENKGGLHKDFNSYILSGTKKGYVTPLEYRYYIASSPDDSLIMFYKFDFSQSALMVEAFVYNNELKLIKEGILPVDKGYLNHGLQLSLAGNIYMLNSKEDGTAAVIYYDLKDKSSRFLEISPSNVDRAYFKINIEEEHSAVLSYINIKGLLLEGISFARFNFKDEKIEWVQFQNLKETIDSLSLKLGENFPRDNFELVHHISTKEGNLFMLEQRNFIHPGNQYQPGIKDDLSYWRPGKARIVLGNILLVLFGPDNELKWAQVIPKNQASTSAEGLITNSFEFEVFEDHIAVLYAVGIGSISQINYVQINWAGEILKSELPNPHGIILLLPYTQWLNAKEIVVVGKKGFASKASLILKYRLP
ncbi:MAG: hypothetical protein M3512_09410 [Bacteroidota bacterium]|nr:hypothetical protein [Bacteroidota bacterium]